MLVAIQSDAVTEPVREVFVSGSVPGAGDHRAGGVVHRARELFRARSIQRGVLSFTNNLKYRLNFGGWFSKNGRASNVRLIAVHAAAAIDEQHGSLLYFFWV